MTMKNTDGRIPEGLMKLHDEFLKLAGRGHVVLSASDCRRIALQLVYEMAASRDYRVVPFPFAKPFDVPANNNNHGPKAA
ncbi:hypothetical protein [Bartonella sp. HY761]|uniref:hypothetical protein n=1 Tax=Bartonella sp. HY761 TaxID=2979330 RepID=UPI0021FBA2F2|nr:hypothetical protein [Bartonella sp. HY761]UXN07538.1 hypothetical protein N6A79_06010 [Bartonella sp. HY761]